MSGDTKGSPVDETTVIPQDGKTPDNVVGDGKNPIEKTPEMLTQETANKLIGAARIEGRTALLNKLGVDNLEALQSMVESHTVAETKRLADEEAAKSELQKKDELLQASIATQTTALNDSIRWQTVAAIQRLAPGKSIPADRFNDLLTLMDKSTIQAKDGVIDDSDVETAIDKTLEGRDYLKAEAAEPEKSNRQGSPTRKPSIFGKNGKTEAPERREKKASI